MTTISFTFEEIGHLFACIQHVKERYQKEGLRLELFGSPMILEKAEHKLTNVLYKQKKSKK